MSTLFKGGLIVDGLGGQHERTDVLVVDGLVAAVGRDLATPNGV